MRDLFAWCILSAVASAAETVELGVEAGIPRLHSHAQVGTERGRITWDRASQLAAVASWHPAGGAWMGVALERLSFSRTDGLGQKIHMLDMRLGLSSRDLDSPWRWSGCWHLAGGLANDDEGGSGGGAWAGGARGAIDYRYGPHLLVGGWLSARWITWQTETGHNGTNQEVQVRGFLPTLGTTVAWSW